MQSVVACEKQFKGISGWSVIFLLSAEQAVWDYSSGWLINDLIVSSVLCGRALGTAGELLECG